MNNPTWYEIRVKGHLDDTLAGWFEDLIISNQENGEVLLRGQFQGLVTKLQNLGLTLISVNAVHEGE